MAVATKPRALKEKRNQQILKDILKWRSENPSLSMQNIFKRLEAKYEGLTFSNAQALYYNKLKRMIEEQDYDFDKSQIEDSVKETLTLNNCPVRLVEQNDSFYFVSKDILKTIGINSASLLLTNLLTDENKSYAQVQSNHCLAKTMIVKVETCKEFFESVIESHPQVKTREKAKKSLQDLNVFLNAINSVPNSESVSPKQDSSSVVQNSTNDIVSEPVAPKSYDPSSDEPRTILTKDFYREDEKVEFKITHINPKSVIGETNDGYNVSGLIYSEDVSDEPVSNLHDYFEVGKVILATVKKFDYELQRLFLTTKNLYRPRTTTSRTATVSPKVSVTVKEENDQHNSKEITYFPQNISMVVENMKESEEQNGLPTLSIQAEKELNAIVNMINNKARIGALSPDAKRKLISMLNDVGLAQMVSGIKDSLPEFQPDLGLLFLNDVEQKIAKGECL